MVFVVCCLTVVSKSSNDNNAPLKQNESLFNG